MTECQTTSYVIQSADVSLFDFGGQERLTTDQKDCDDDDVLNTLCTYRTVTRYFDYDRV